MLSACIGLALMGSCSDDDAALPLVEPQATGTYVDVRDNYEYHWVRINGLDWTVENAHYQIGDPSKCRFYVPYEDWEEDSPEDKMSDEFGYLYSYQGAQEAVPEGWRLPTDEDWQQLEMALGMSEAQASAREWRGDFAASLMMQKGEGTALAFQLGGYYTSYLGYYDPHYWHNGTYGYYWTDTKDENKSGDYIMYRKLAYNRQQVYRESIEAKEYMLSVRFVRNAE